MVELVLWVFLLCISDLGDTQQTLTGSLNKECRYRHDCDDKVSCTNDFCIDGLCVHEGFCSCGDCIIPKLVEGCNEVETAACICMWDSVCCLRIFDIFCVDLAMARCGCVGTSFPTAAPSPFRTAAPTITSGPTPLPTAAPTVERTSEPTFVETFCDIILEGRVGFNDAINGIYIVQGESVKRPTYLNSQTGYLIHFLKLQQVWIISEMIEEDSGFAFLADNRNTPDESSESWNVWVKVEWEADEFLHAICIDNLWPTRCLGDYCLGMRGLSCVAACAQYGKSCDSRYVSFGDHIRHFFDGCSTNDSLLKSSCVGPFVVNDPRTPDFFGTCSDVSLIFANYVTDCGCFDERTSRLCSCSKIATIAPTNIPTLQPVPSSTPVPTRAPHGQLPAVPPGRSPLSTAAPPGQSVPPPGTPPGRDPGQDEECPEERRCLRGDLISFGEIICCQEDEECVPGNTAEEGSHCISTQTDPIETCPRARKCVVNNDILSDNVICCNTNQICIAQTNPEGGGRCVSVFTVAPTNIPTPAPTRDPMAPHIPKVTETPTLHPTTLPTPIRTPNPTPHATPHPTRTPTADPTPNPTAQPTPVPTAKPSPVPTRDPTPKPTTLPTPTPTSIPTVGPTPSHTVVPTPPPSVHPSAKPTKRPIRTWRPTFTPSGAPTRKPTPHVTRAPSTPPTRPPSAMPTVAPTRPPSVRPTAAPTKLSDPLDPCGTCNDIHSDAECSIPHLERCICTFDPWCCDRRQGTWDTSCTGFVPECLRILQSQGIVLECRNGPA